MASRTWTDGQLREAVAGQRSWRGVLRALGLKGTSSSSIRTVKRHAARLGLDTTHFNRQPKWSDQDLMDAVARSASWAEVVRHLQLDDDDHVRVRVKGQAIRLGLDVSHLEDPVVAGSSNLAFARPATPSALRDAAPLIATAWFAVRGMPVAVPSEQQAYDLLVTMPDGIQRVQVKSTTARATNGKWRAGISHRPYSLDKTAGKVPYDPDSIDYFLVINGLGEIYLIPTPVVAGLTTIHLDGYADYKVGDASSLLG